MIKFYEKKYYNFNQIEKEKKTKIVSKIFHSIAEKYDLMNDVMSFGIHRIWKNTTIKLSDVCRGEYVLDLAGGTGDLTKKFAKIVGENGKIVLADINDSMLNISRTKMRNLGFIKNISYIQTNAELLPFYDNYFDCVTVSFGLRNFTNKKKAIKSIFRILKPGGRLLILEFSKPNFKTLRKIYDLYSFYVLPIIGKIIANDANSYQYLVESIRSYPNQKIIKKILESVGFKQVFYTKMTGGIVSIHKGFKF